MLSWCGRCDGLGLIVVLGDDPDALKCRDGERMWGERDQERCVLCGSLVWENLIKGFRFSDKDES
jgi:hypothetical protein